ncbi:MAG TPA: histone deacetylase [Bryobacteraceae bacterium]|nr:histone deacetylase [Bryobacteraceae bacterium]
MQPRLFYCDHHTIPLPEGHKFPAAKYRVLRELLESDGEFRLEQALLAPRELIELAHDCDYVSGFLDGTLDPAAMRRIGFPWSQGLVTRTLASLGGTLAASKDALDTGFGGNLAGGTHHAFRSAGAGFCVFNDIAVAILNLRCSGRATRVAVIDLDVHQGDGTAAIFRDDPAVFTLSIHGRNNFPFRKERSCLDLDLPDGTSDAAYLDALAGVLPRVFAYVPHIVFYQSGVDGLAGDRLGKLALTHEGLRCRDQMVFEACRAHGVPVVVTLGGGYAEPISRTAEAHANTFRAAAKIFSATSAWSARCAV